MPPHAFVAAALLATVFASHAESLTSTEAQQIAEDAYIYGYSLITTDVTRVQMSNVPEVQGMKAPMGEFFNPFVDAEGKKLNGANKYTLTFSKGLTPPVDGFWSITMYFDDGGWWFYPNPLNKFTVSMRDKPKFNDDGSLTLYFQHQSPGTDKEANWLPSPAGDFLLRSF
jgi:hypothetical protein